MAKVWVAVLACLSFFDRYRMRVAHEGLPRYRVYGDASKPPVVLVPGLDGCASFFAGALPELSRHFRVVVYELPLVGDAGFEDYSFASLARGVVGVLDALGVKEAAVVGESFGGVVALHLALEAPSRVSKLLLLSSLAKTELTWEVALKKDLALPVVRLLGKFFPNVAQSAFAYVHSSDVVEASEPAWVKNFFIKEASWAHHASVMARLSIVIPLDITARVGAIAQPTRLLYGADDTFTGQTTDALLALLPNAEKRALPGGHLPHVTSPAAFADSVIDFFGAAETRAITADDVAAAQRRWGDSLVEIGAAFSSGGDYKARGKRALDELYGYASGFSVLFKPTKAAKIPIRLTEEEAVSYFVGAGSCDEDKGFALAPFTAVRFDNKGTIIDGDSATAMGEYYLTDAGGGLTKVEYTFEYRRAADGALKIVVHHSSIPYAPH